MCFQTAGVGLLGGRYAVPVSLQDGIALLLLPAGVLYGLSGAAGLPLPSI